MKTTEPFSSLITLALICIAAADILLTGDFYCHIYEHIFVFQTEIAEIGKDWLHSLPLPPGSRKLPKKCMDGIDDRVLLVHIRRRGLQIACGGTQTY